MVTATAAVSEMWEQYKSTHDPVLKEQLILQYGPLVKYVVSRMAIGLPGVLSTEDLNSHATIGLIDAIERFDPARGLKFEFYAIARLRGSVVDAVGPAPSHSGVAGARPAVNSDVLCGRIDLAGDRAGTGGIGIPGLPVAYPGDEPATGYLIQRWLYRR
jgi:hypothetical protein